MMLQLLPGKVNSRFRGPNNHELSNGPGYSKDICQRHIAHSLRPLRARKLPDCSIGELLNGIWCQIPQEQLRCIQVLQASCTLWKLSFLSPWGLEVLKTISKCFYRLCASMRMQVMLACLHGLEYHVSSFSRQRERFLQALCILRK